MSSYEQLLGCKIQNLKGKTLNCNLNWYTFKQLVHSKNIILLP
jgi:hypothetical protein